MDVRIPFLRPRMPCPEEWLPFLAESHRRNWFSNFGPAHESLSAALEERYCAPGRRALPVANCTVGLAAALVALDIRGIVAIPSFTFPATLQAVRMAGCEPCFVEADPATWEMSVEHLADLFDRIPIRAVITVRAFGFCREQGAVSECCRAHGVPLVVDAAAALGGYIHPGFAAGQDGEAEIFSMHATKVFAVGEGGVIFAREGLISRLREAVNFGLNGGASIGRGFNGKLSEVHCAIGMAVLRDIDAAIAARAAVSSRYSRLLNGSAIAGPTGGIGSPPWQTYPALMPSAAAAEGAVRIAEARGIQVRRYYRPALHRVHAAPVDSGALPVSGSLSDRMVCLPVLPDATQQEQARLDEFCAAIRSGEEP
jgi:dTDP-4-amino-4,6-dideoxygalactose transaminase